MAYLDNRVRRCAQPAGFCFAVPLVLVPITLAASPALAAEPQDLCLQSNASAPQTLVDPGELGRATREAETILAGLRDQLSGDRALERMVVAASGTGHSDPLALAEYCSTAGEAMRVARSGSSNQAQAFLLNALAEIEGKDAPRLRAGIAYRLSLVSRNRPVRPNARSAKRSLSRAVQALELPTGLVGNDSVDGCRTLMRVGSSDQSNWAVSKLALECAASSAGKAGLIETVTVSQLQISRISLSEAARQLEDRDFLREEAAIASVSGLGSVAGVADRALRFELAARLVESTIEAGYARDASVREGLALLAEDLSRDPGEQARFFALQGRLLLTEGRTSVAAANLRQAIFFESQRLQPLRLADWYLLLSEADLPNRASHVMEAYDALEAIRPLLPSTDPITEESFFKLRMQPVFNAAVEVQLSAQQAAGGKEPDSARILRAQQIVESFRQAEIQHVFGADCVPPRIPVSPADLKPGEILLYPILLKDRVEVLYAAKSGDTGVPQYERFTVTEGADLERIETLVKTASVELGYGSDNSWEQPTSELYSILIAPIEDRLSADTTLIIVPDGILRRLPFAALRDGDGKMLIEKTRLTVAPSLAYTQPGNDRRKSTHVVAASLSVPVDLPAGFFPALEATSAEAEMAAGLGDARAPGGVHLANFTRADLVNAFSDSSIDVLHLATHASFNGRSDRSFIVAEDGPILLSELRKLIGDSMTRGELLTLIVLSACETALGDDQASMGLAGAAVQAGSESAIASLWEVSDEGTAKLMQEFYHYYAKGQGRAEALRNAQLALIAEGGGLADPRIWAAFTLLGAWR